MLLDRWQAVAGGQRGMCRMLCEGLGRELAPLGHGDLGVRRIGDRAEILKALLEDRDDVAGVLRKHMANLARGDRSKYVDDLIYSMQHHHHILCATPSVHSAPPG